MSKRKVCISINIWGLFVYLLLCEDKYLKSTLYFICNTISGNIIDKLPIHSCFSFGFYSFKKALYTRLRLVAKWTKYYFSSDIYAQDFSSFPSIFIGTKKYTVIEDGVGSYSTFSCNHVINKYVEKPTLKQKVSWFLVRGPIALRSLGRNKYCIDRIFTSIKDSNAPIFKNTKHTYLDVNLTWAKCSEYKKKFICNVFGMTDEQIKHYQKYQVIILTQNFSVYGILSEDEQIELYSSIVSKYEDENVIIKPHPFDNIDYKKNIRNIEVMDSLAPMQLITLVGIKLKKAITITSGALSVLPEDTQKIWLGPSVHPKLLETYGNMKCPY